MPPPPACLQELDRLQGEAARLATMAEETGAQIRAAEQRLRTARLAHICSLSIELPAAQVLMAALHPM